VEVSRFLATESSDTKCTIACIFRFCDGVIDSAVIESSVVGMMSAGASAGQYADTPAGR